MNNNELSSFEHFCGGEFWNLSLTWYTYHPDFTPCFERTALVWAPCAFLLILLPLYVGYMRTLPSLRIRNTRLHVAKLVLTILLFILSVIDLIKGSVDYSKDTKNVPLVVVVSPLIRTITFIIAFFLVRFERRKGFITSGIFFLFYFLNTLAGIPIINSYALHSIKDDFHLVTFSMFFAFVVLQLLVFSFADRLQSPPSQNETQSNKKPCPEVEASFLSRITFWWINGLVLAGYKTTLKEDDIWEPNPRDVTRNCSPPLEEAWKNELMRCNWTEFPDHRKTSTVSDGRMKRSNGTQSETSPLLKNDIHRRKYSRQEDDDATTTEVKGGGRGGKKKEPSLLWVMTKVFGPTLLLAHLCKVVCDLLTFVGPMLQNVLIGYTENTSVEKWKGYFYAVLFFATSVVNSFFFHQLFHIGMTLGMRVKASLISLVYKKALTMSNEARKTTTVGEIVNLMSVDAQRLQDAVGYLWMTWSAPLQIALAVTLLWNLVGVSVLAGLGVMILLIPINAALAGFQRKLQIAQMQQKDQRIKLMNEVLNGIRVLKLYAWELSFQEKVNVIRENELETLRKYSYIGAVGTFTWTCAPFLVTLATFATYVLLGGVLDAQRAFTALSLFNILRFPINMLPMMISYLVTASVSIKRLGKFLQNLDIDESNVSHDPSTAHPILIERGTFAWGTGKDDSPILKNINLHIIEKSLTAVVGQVGVGKSSLLFAMLGEMEKLEGHVNVRGSIAFVPQQAWIQNASVKDNILFGKPFDEERYNKVLDACALRPDLEILPAGDNTEIGEKGINLSGGQKQRVSVARAVYQDCDLYLLDDPLSAVDSHVGKHIFEEVVGKNGLLKNKTRILVTHGVHWLPLVDDIVVLKNGEISEKGSYDELLSHDVEFALFLRTFLVQEKNEDEGEETDPEILKLKNQILERVDSLIDDQSQIPGERKKSVSIASKGSDIDSQDETSSKSSARRRRKLTTQASSLSDHAGLKRQRSVKPEAVPEKPKSKDKLIQEETSETGQVKMAVFLSYCKSLGYVMSLLLLIFFLLYQIFSVLSSVWLSRWTEDSILKNTSIVNTSTYTNKQNFYLGVYGGFGAAQAVAVLLYSIVAAVTNVSSSRALHNQMLSNILRSPMMFFDTTPIGRILNRFSRDIETIDNILPQLIRSWLNTFFSVISTLIIISYSTPIFLSVVVPLALLYYFIQRFYIPLSRQLKRIESTSRSPIYVHFSETITGASTIRAYNKQIDFMRHSEGLVDHNLVFYFGAIASNRWLGFRLEVLGGAIILAAAMFAVVGRGTISGGIVGLSISYALQITGALNWMVRMTTDLETNIVSVERVKEYSETPTEADWHDGLIRPPSNWPSRGLVKFDHYATRYRPGLPLVLDDISVTIEDGERVGIVGRTGAGKSSMTLALFRLIEAAAGRIVIDDVVISDVGLYELRGKITILPQDPVIFSGTLRMNLDPFEIYSSEKIWQALEHSHLKDFVKSLPTQLEYECGEGGQNLSVGQRQLVCLARTLLRKTKILILDEATAAVDLETDELIQKTIQQEFKDCTVLTIAHRLNTIMESNRVMVLDGGKVHEIASPKELLEDKNSKFYSLAKDAGIRIENGN